MAEAVGRRGLAPQVGVEGAGKVSGKVSLWLQGRLRHSRQEPEHRQIGWNGGIFQGTKSLTCLCGKQTERPVESHQQCSRPAVTEPRVRIHVVLVLTVMRSCVVLNLND